MRNFLLLPAGSLLAGLLLSSCSHSSDTATTDAATSAVLPPATRTAGTAVDSLNGVPGHHFGDALSTFPGLVKNEYSGPGPLVSYYYPRTSTHELPWFAKHREEVSTMYFFRDGRFAKFNAMTTFPEAQATLVQEARYLFGAGQDLGDRTEWAGSRAAATISSGFVNGRATKILVVSSVAQQQQQAADDQAHLKAENSGQ